MATERAQIPASLLIRMRSSLLNRKFLSSKTRRPTRQSYLQTVNHKMTASHLLMVMWLLGCSVASAMANSNPCPDGDCCSVTEITISKKTLSCSRLNDIPSPKQAHENAADITNFTISSSRIATIKANALKDYGNALKELILKKNGISTIEDGAFANLKILTMLDLSENELATLNMDVFSNCSALKTLRLQKNKIHRLDSGLSLQELSILDLSYNALKTFDNNLLFISAVNVRTLRLSGNSLKSITGPVLAPLTQLQDLEVDGNPWHCDCGLASLFELMRNSDSLKRLTNKITCASPPFMADKIFSDLESRSDLFCMSIDSVVGVIGDQVFEKHIDPTSVSSSGDVTFGCRIRSDPSKPGREWQFKNQLIESSNVDKYSFLESDLDTSYFFWYNLTVRAPTNKDYGVYTCVIDNDYITSSKEIHYGPESDTSTPLTVVKAGGSRAWIWILVIILLVIIIVSIAVLLLFCIRRRGLGRRVATVTYQPGTPEKPSSPSAANGQTVKDSQHQDTITPLLGDSYISSRSQVSPDRTPRFHSTFNSLQRQMSEQPQQPTRPEYFRRAQTPDVFSPRGMPQQNVPYPYAYSSFDPRRRPRTPMAFNYPARPNPLHGSMTSVFSEPMGPRVPMGTGYVTMPRQRRLPSWNPVDEAYARTPLSPTGSLYNFRQPYSFDQPSVSDGIGPRRTADGGSNLSINQAGLMPSSSRPPSRSGILTPSTPITPSYNPRIYRPLAVPMTPRSAGPIGNNIYEPISPSPSFAFNPLPEGEEEPYGTVGYSKKAPPPVPMKPQGKRVSVIAEETAVPEWEYVKGTEV